MRAKLGYSRQRREEKDLAFLCAWNWGGASRKKGMRPWAGAGGVSGCGDLGGEAQLGTGENIAEASAGHRGACLCWLLKEGLLTQAGGLEKGFLEKVTP